jgi:VWFA-related protein
MRQAVFISLLLSAMLPVGKTCPCSQKENLANIDEAIKLGVELVVFDAHVLNKRTGRLIGGLEKNHFTIYEDGARQQITHFSQDLLPLSIIILIDTSRSVWPFIGQIRQGALRSLEHLKPEDEIALIATAARTQLVQGFSTNRRLIAERIKSLDEKALGDDGILLHEAIYQAASHFRKAGKPNHRRAIIVITDDMTTQKLTSQGHSEKEAFDELYESGVTVCGLLAGDYALKRRLDSFYKMKWYDPLGNIVKKTAGMKSPFGPGSIQTYARDTGGVVKEVEKDDASAKLTEILIQLRSRYSFGYVSSKAKLDGKFRRIRLTVSSVIEKRERGLAIITRRGYYARR